jgi:hypothetical protein
LASGEAQLAAVHLDLVCGSGLDAGPCCTEPFWALNWLPWQGHLMEPPDTSPTVQP